MSDNPAAAMRGGAGDDLGAALAAWSCPLPLRDHDRIVTGHGGGGRLGQELVEHLFLPAFGEGAGGDGEVALSDAAVLSGPALPAAGGRLAMSTDSYVVQPLFFPGGCIGDLAVHGTVNDLAMAGAMPVALSVGFILEEGLELAALGLVAQRMGGAAREAGVRIVTGDTKVVGRGQADGLYVNTAGVGVVAPGVDVGPHRARPGDRIVVSGPIGRHGVAILSVREGLQFGTDLVSDTQPLHRLVAAMLASDAGPGAVHTLRDPTRGGLGASLCELAATGGVGVEYDEATVPVPDAVAAACSFLGLDPMHVANEGCLVAFVAPDATEAVLQAMHEAGPVGAEAVVIGEVVDEHPGIVVARTAFGARRVVDLPMGEQLPRIC